MKKLILLIILGVGLVGFFMFPIADYFYDDADARGIILLGSSTMTTGDPTITFVTSNDNSVYAPGTTLATDTTINVGIGDLVVIAISYFTSSTLSAQDDASSPNTFTFGAETGASGSKRYARIGYCIITTAKTGATITATFGTTQGETCMIYVLQFSKNTGTWHYEDQATVTPDYVFSIASGNYSTSYADGVSVAIASSSNDAGDFTNTDINNLDATLAPASPEGANLARTFYLLHGIVSNNHADIAKSTETWLCATMAVFGLE